MLQCFLKAIPRTVFRTDVVLLSSPCAFMCVHTLTRVQQSLVAHDPLSYCLFPDVSEVPLVRT